MPRRKHICIIESEHRFLLLWVLALVTVCVCIASRQAYKARPAVIIASCWPACLPWVSHEYLPAGDEFGLEMDCRARCAVFAVVLVGPVTCTDSAMCCICCCPSWSSHLYWQRNVLYLLLSQLVQSAERHRHRRLVDSCFGLSWLVPMIRDVADSQLSPHSCCFAGHSH